MSQAAERRLSPAEREFVERLVRRVAPRLAAYVRHCFVPGADVEDVVSEAVTRAIRRIDVWVRHPEPELYLFRTARHLCLDEWARQRRLRRIGTEAAGVRPSDGPAGGLEASESRERLLRELARLPAAQREVVVLRMSAGMTFEKIAELLDVPLGTALSRMHAALSTLRRALRDEDDQPRR